ncbi:MAG TPA: hypothetical protein VGP22_12405, partial [Albitalea sp.]|nr:hypothetical protein [Albitalea sp.]
QVRRRGRLDVEAAMPGRPDWLPPISKTNCPRIPGLFDPSPPTPLTTMASSPNEARVKFGVFGLGL